MIAYSEILSLISNLYWTGQPLSCIDQETPVWILFTQHRSIFSCSENKFVTDNNTKEESDSAQTESQALLPAASGRNCSELLFNLVWSEIRYWLSRHILWVALCFMIIAWESPALNFFSSSHLMNSLLFCGLDGKLWRARCGLWASSWQSLDNTLNYPAGYKVVKRSFILTKCKCILLKRSQRQCSQHGYC